MFKVTEASTMHAVAVVVIFALISISSASLCERHTCPPGLVYVYFEYENCTGARTYRSMEVPVFGDCKSGEGGSYITRLYSTYIEDLFYDGVGDCGGGRADAVVNQGSRHYFGVCTLDRGLSRGELKPSSLSYMILANVNDSFVSPQEKFVDLNVPAYPKVIESPCESEADCKSQGFFFFKKYANNTCPAEGTSFEVNDVVQAYKCYRDGTLGEYFSVGCYGPHTVEINTYNDNACTRLVRTNFDGNKCGLGLGSNTFYCTAVKPAIVTSSASSFRPLMMFWVALAALFTVF